MKFYAMREIEKDIGIAESSKDEKMVHELGVVQKAFSEFFKEYAFFLEFIDGRFDEVESEKLRVEYIEFRISNMQLMVFPFARSVENYLDGIRELI